MDICNDNSHPFTKPPGFRGTNVMSITPPLHQIGATFCVQYLVLYGDLRSGVPMEATKLAPSEAANNNRRALGDIKNLVGAPLYPCAISKKEQPDKKNGAEKKSSAAFAANRPITRRFAATLKSQSAGQDSNLAPQNLNNPANCVAVDIDDLGRPANNDVALPMVEDDAVDCELTEVEMEDLLDEESVMDIDGGDLKNPLAAVEYIDDLYSFYRQTEVSGCVSPNYMSNQFDINEKMRAILIDWLIEVHYKFELMDETLFLTVNIIDRFLARQTVLRRKLQLVGVTAMLLACKYEEVSVPVVEDLILISDGAYTRDEVLQMEKLIVNTLQFNMSVPTAYVFMRRFIKAAQSDKKMELLAFFLIELCLVKYDMLKFEPSLLAAAAVYTAQSTLKGFKHWNKTCEVQSHYTEEQLRECSMRMVDFHQKAAVGKLTGVHRKYSTFKFGYAAKSEPALFLLDETQS